MRSGFPEELPAAVHAAWLQSLRERQRTQSGKHALQVRGLAGGVDLQRDPIEYRIHQVVRIVVGVEDHL